VGSAHRRLSHAGRGVVSILFPEGVSFKPLFGGDQATGPAIRVTVATWEVPEVSVHEIRTLSPGE
jgi:hypothetical protein